MNIPVTYNGQQYYANILLPPAGSNTGMIYFAQVADACTDGDQAISLTLRNGSLADYNTIITAACQTKKIVETEVLGILLQRLNLTPIFLNFSVENIV